MMDRFVLVVDVETTGFGHVAKPPRDDRVVQVGLAYRGTDGEIRTWDSVCNPGEAYLAGGRADEALKINGLTVEDVLSAPPAKEVAAEFWEEVEAAERDRDALAEFRAFNVDFDRPFLSRSPWRVPDRRWGPCIMKRAAVYLDGADGKWPKLEEAAYMVGLEWPEGGAHDAGVDAQVAMRVDQVLRQRRA